MGTHPDLVTDLDSVDAAVDRALDLSAPAPTPIDFPAPANEQEARNTSAIIQPITWWLGQMATNPRLVEERLVWFWSDHFATGLQKVRSPYLMWRQHLTIRQHATGSFADLLRAIARDPAMLVYLDGVSNAARNRNENFGREVMELFTLGRGEYAQEDVVEAARAFTGWVVNIPGRPQTERITETLGAGPWEAALVPFRFDRGSKTLLGVTGNLDMDGALDVILDQPATATRVAGKLHTALVGREASAKTAKRLAKLWRDADYQVMPLVEAIVHGDEFTADEAIRTRVRTPVEKLVALTQAFPGAAGSMSITDRRGRAPASGLADALRTIGYIPFVPPHVDGYPKDHHLLGPHQLVHSFDLLSVFSSAPPVPDDVDDLFARFAIFDVSNDTRATIRREKDPGTRLALAFGAPEMIVT